MSSDQTFFFSWILICSGIVFSFQLETFTQPFSVVYGFIFSISALTYFLRKKCCLIPLIVLLSAVLGISRGSATMHRKNHDTSEKNSGIAECSFMITGFSSPAAVGSNCCNILIYKENNRFCLKLDKMFFSQKYDLYPSETVSGTLRKNAADCFIPLESPQELFSRRTGSHGVSLKKLHTVNSFPVSDGIKRFIRDIRIYLSQPSLLFFQRAVLNIRDYRNDELFLYRSLGILPFLAISGLHFGILNIFAGLFFRGKTGALFSLTVLLFYLFVTGVPPSALRAFIMISTRNAARSFRRTAVPERHLFFSGMIQVLLFPEDAFSIGYYLSYSAMMIILFLINMQMKMIRKIFFIQLLLFPFTPLFFRECFFAAFITCPLLSPFMTAAVAGGYGICFLSIFPEFIRLKGYWLYNLYFETIKMAFDLIMPFSPATGGFFLIAAVAGVLFLIGSAAGRPLKYMGMSLFCITVFFSDQLLLLRSPVFVTGASDNPVVIAAGYEKSIVFSRNRRDVSGLEKTLIKSGCRSVVWKQYDKSQFVQKHLIPLELQRIILAGKSTCDLDVYDFAGIDL